MRKNIAPKGSVPVVCYHTETKSYLALDANHPLMSEDFIKTIGSIADFDMNGQPRKKSLSRIEEAIKKVEESKVLDLGGAEVIEPTEPKKDVYTKAELKDLLTNLGVQWKNTMSASTLQDMYDEAINKTED